MNCPNCKKGHLLSFYDHYRCDRCMIDVSRAFFPSHREEPKVEEPKMKQVEQLIFFPETKNIDFRVRTW